MAGKKILLVEGTDDEHVFMHLCGERSVGQLDIKREGSVEKLLESFPVRLKESDLEVLGVVLDADTDLAGRWEALKHRLIDARYNNVPPQLASDGMILFPPPDSQLPRVGVWIMPDNKTTGKLEDFLRLLVPTSKRRLLEHAESSVQGIPEEDRLFSKPDEIKATMYTWLAWQKEPGRPYGTAIAAKFLDPNIPQADVLVAWLKRLFFP